MNYKGESLLKYGDLSILSFHATKVFNTFEGGAIICHDAKTKKRIDHLKNFGYVDEVTVVAPGINAKMNELQAAFGLLQLKYVNKAIDRRKGMDHLYREELSTVSGIFCPQLPTDTTYNYAYFPILIEKEYPLSRDELNDKLRHHGIFARRYFYPLISEFPMYRGMQSAAQANLPIASKVACQVLCLPIYPALEFDHLTQIIQIIRSA